MPEPTNTIIVTVHNKCWLISAVIDAIIQRSKLPFNLVVVFDGCSDKSEVRAAATLYREADTTPETHYAIGADGKATMFSAQQGYNQIRSVKFLYLPDVFETISNNRGMQAFPDSDYYILLQDDMIVAEDGWDERILRPLKKFDDVFAVSARGAFNLYNRQPGVRTADIEDRVGRDDGRGPRGNLQVNREKLYIRDNINRGPIAFDGPKIRALNFFDEAFAPFMWDDTDLCFRAYAQHRWKCGFYSVDYISDVAWGSTRINAGQSVEWGGFAPSQEVLDKAAAWRANCDRAWSKNLRQVYERHLPLLLAPKHSEEREI